MKKLVQGIHRFQRDVFTNERELFARLAKGQEPETLFITCSDSRVNPNLLTMTGPGDLFILRNAGNIIPPYGRTNGAEAATIEYAVAGLGVKDVIVCGHSMCGACAALHDPDSVKDMPAVREWLEYAEATRRIIQENYPDLTPEERAVVTVEENVLVQIENLRTHPAVAARVAKGALKIHGWVYKIETGEVFAFDPDTEQFSPITEHKITPVAVRTNRVAI